MRRASTTFVLPLSAAACLWWACRPAGPNAPDAVVPEPARPPALDAAVEAPAADGQEPAELPVPEYQGLPDAVALGVSAADFARAHPALAGVRANDDYLCPASVEGLEGLWSFPFEQERLVSYRWFATLEEDANVRQAFLGRRAAAQRIVAAFTQRLGKPDVLSGSPAYVPPWRHFGYSVVLARWHTPKVHVQAAFDFASGKGEWSLPVEIEVRPRSTPFEPRF